MCSSKLCMFLLYTGDIYHIITDILGIYTILLLIHIFGSEAVHYHYMAEPVKTGQW